MRSRIALAVAALGTIAGALWLGDVSGARRSTQRDDTVRDSPAGAPHLDPRGRDEIALRLRDEPPATDSDRPSSLRGTEVDGALAIDGTGELVVGPDLLRFFDYFLSATGEEPLEQLAGRIESEIDARLAPDAAGRARALLKRYVDYRERARGLSAPDGARADLTAKWDALRRLRRDVFGERDAEALFGEEEAAAFVALAQRGVAADPALSPEERAERVAELETQLPDGAREARRIATAPLQLARDEAELRAAGGGPAEIRALRERHFGPEAADRLAALDVQRAEWRSRVEDYRAARAAIESDTSRTAAERAHAVEALLADRFSPTERLRVQALDRLAAREDG